METLKIYRITDKYINYLKGTDNKVPHNKNNHRPYVGIVLYVGEFQYFVPLESPKPNHQNIKSGKHLLKLDNGNLGLMGFNNMIPVHKSALIYFDINSEQDEKYRELLKRQASWINKNKAKIYERASKTYYTVSMKNNDFMNRVCCDFKKLEKACKNYNPNYVRKTYKYKHKKVKI